MAEFHLDMPQKQSMLNIQQVADILGVSRRTVNNLCISGEIHAVRVAKTWRIPPTAVEEFITKNSNQA